MGRHRKHPTDENNVKPANRFADTESVSEVAERRLGLRNRVCRECNANAPPDADRCRRCGSTSLRRKAAEFNDE